jgi:hypothetical protein
MDGALAHTIIIVLQSFTPSRRYSNKSVQLINGQRYGGIVTKREQQPTPRSIDQETSIDL